MSMNSLSNNEPAAYIVDLEGGKVRNRQRRHVHVRRVRQPRALPRRPTGRALPLVVRHPSQGVVLMRVQLGNTAPHEVLHRDEVKRRGLKPADYDAHDKDQLRVPLDVADAVTDVAIPEDRSLRDAFLEVAHLWDYHSSAPPAWVASDSEGLAALLAEHYSCDIAELQVEEV